MADGFLWRWCSPFGRGCVLRVGKEARVSLGRETVSRGGLTIRAEQGKIVIGDKCFFNTNCSLTAMGGHHHRGSLPVRQQPGHCGS